MTRTILFKILIAFFLFNTAFLFSISREEVKSLFNAAVNFSITIAPAPSLPKPKNVSPSHQANLSAPFSFTVSFENPPTPPSRVEWLFRRNDGTFDVPRYSVETAGDASTLTAVPDGTFVGNETYFWRIRFQNAEGTWSDYSDETSFSVISQTSGGPNVMVGSGGSSVPPPAPPASSAAPPSPSVAPPPTPSVAPSSPVPSLSQENPLAAKRPRKNRPTVKLKSKKISKGKPLEIRIEPAAPLIRPSAVNAAGQLEIIIQKRQPKIFERPLMKRQKEPLRAFEDQSIIKKPVPETANLEPGLYEAIINIFDPDNVTTYANIEDFEVTRRGIENIMRLFLIWLEISIIVGLAVFAMIRQRKRVH